MTSSLPLREQLADAVVMQPLAISDAAVAAEVIRAAFAAQPRPTHPPSSALRESAASIAEKIETGGGFGAWVEELHVARVSVLPEWRGEGLSRRLLEMCEATARARGLPRMTLRVRLALPENERRFERLGFRRVGVETHEGFDAPTVVAMEKRLS